MDGWIGAKAGLRIAYSNQKSQFTSKTIYIESNSITFNIFWISFNLFSFDLIRTQIHCNDTDFVDQFQSKQSNKIKTIRLRFQTKFRSKSIQSPKLSVKPPSPRNFNQLYDVICKCSVTLYFYFI